MQCKALRDSDREIRAYNVAYFMASTDTIEDNTAFAAEHEATFPILADPKKSMCGSYGVLSQGGYARRWTYYIDADGIIRKIDKEVNPRTAGEQLVDNLEGLKFPKRS
jgi:peroxiredoxin Q/BCP|tara:strand:- start:3125 stop:3448 length:324 start_codon:yes stop_codon:yes gene_type:complete